MAEKELRNRFNGKKYLLLGLSLLLDAIGMATFLLPGLGELADLFWAPVAGLASFLMFGGMTGATGALFTFAEELMPGTDWVPSLTLTWVYKYVIRSSHTYSAFSRHHLLAASN